MDTKPSLSVVLTFFNEQEVLEEMVTRLRTVFRHDLQDLIGRYELIFVNDRSTDRSEEILRHLAQGERDIRIINMSSRFGVYPCVMAGVRYASGDAVIYLDCDLQDPPEVIPRMVQVWQEEQADVVHTKRSSRAGESWMKLQITRAGYWFLNRICNIHIEPNVGDFKLMSRRVVNELLRLKEVNPFVRGLVNWIGFKQKTILYDRDARFAGETLRPVYSWAVITHFLDYALIAFSDLPLKIFLILGFLVCFGTLGYLVVALVLAALSAAVPAWAWLLSALFLLSGIQLTAMGVMGLYLYAVFLQSKNRPHYIIDNTYGFDEENH